MNYPKDFFKTISNFQVQSALLSVSENYEVHHSIREAAILSLITLPQNSSFFTRLALSTWREPDYHVSSFIYSILKSISQTTDPAYLKK